MRPRDCIDLTLADQQLTARCVSAFHDRRAHSEEDTLAPGRIAPFHLLALRPFHFDHFAELEQRLPIRGQVDWPPSVGKRIRQPVHRFPNTVIGEEWQRQFPRFRQVEKRTASLFQRAVFF